MGVAEKRGKNYVELAAREFPGKHSGMHLLQTGLILSFFSGLRFLWRNTFSAAGIMRITISYGKKGMMGGICIKFIYS